MNKIINHNYKIKLLHKKYKSILIFFKLFCFFFILILKKYGNYFILFYKNILNINQTIIETQTYEKFQNIKDRFNNDPFLNNYLKEIRILILFPFYKFSLFYTILRNYKIKSYI